MKKLFIIISILSINFSLYSIDNSNKGRNAKDPVLSETNNRLTMPKAKKLGRRGRSPYFPARR